MRKGSVRKHLQQAIPAYVILAVVLIVVFAISPGFRKVGNIRNIIAQSSVLAIVSIAQSSVLLIGGIDMSVSSVISISTVMIALFSSSGGGIILSILLAVGIGLLTGFINGVGVVKFRIPAMIITISTQAVIKGIALILLPDRGGSVNPHMAAFFKTRLGVFNVSALFALLLYVVFFMLLHYTRLGRHIYAVGNHEVYAKQSGVASEKIIVITHMLSGLIAAFAGIVLSSRIATGNALVGDSYAMDSVAAAIVGGISMSGGLGSVIGALAGAVIMTLINNVINLMGISPYYQYITKGLVLVVSLMIFQIRKRKKL